MDGLGPLVVEYATNALGAIVLLCAAWIVAGFAAQSVARGLRKTDFDETLTRFFAKAVRWLILLLAVLMCLSIFGVETTSFAAVIGAAGLAIGLAFQGTLGNFASGVMLLIFRPFKVGDVVSVAGQTGKIYAIELFTTTLDTPDNRRIIIPNGQVFGSVIENISHHSTRRVDVTVGVGYGADLDQTRDVLQQAIGTIDRGLADPEPAVVLLELGASSVDWAVRVWVDAGDYWDVKQQLTRAVKIALDGAGIDIPYPQMDVHLDSPAGA